MKIGRIYVDFNNVVDKHIVLLSREDFAIDSNGDKIELYDGQLVHIYEDDRNDLGERDDLVAEGIVERKSNSATYATTYQWLCRIVPDSIMNQSELDKLQASGA